MFQDHHTISTTKTMMKKHECKKSHSKSTTFSHTYLSHYFKSNKTIYKLFNEIYKAIYKKHNIIYQISNQLFLLLMNIKNRQSNSQSKKNMKM